MPINYLRAPGCRTPKHPKGRAPKDHQIEVQLVMQELVEFARLFVLELPQLLREALGEGFHILEE